MKALESSDVILDPYPHVAVRDFTGLGDALAANFPPIEIFGQTVRMDGDLFSEDPAFVSYRQENAVYRALVEQLKSASLVSNLIAAFDNVIADEVKKGELLLDPRVLKIVDEPLETRAGAPVREMAEPLLFCRIDLGFGGVDYGLKNGGGGIHTDNRRRLFSGPLYINTPADMIGGEHRMYAVDNDFNPSLSKSYAPRADLFVASLQSNLAFHDVNPITQITGVRQAIYVGVTCTTDIWKQIPSTRQAELAKNRPFPGFFTRNTHRASQFARGLF